MPPLILPVDVLQVVSAKVREDHGAVAIGLEITGGDRLMLGMSPAVLDGVIESLRLIREALTANGVEPTIAFKPVHSVAVGEYQLEGRPFVLLTIDRSLPSAQAFLLPPKNAQIVGKEMRRTARVISAARGDGPQPEVTDAEA